MIEPVRGNEGRARWRVEEVGGENARRRKRYSRELFDAGPNDVTLGVVRQRVSESPSGIGIAADHPRTRTDMAPPGWGPVGSGLGSGLGSGSVVGAAEALEVGDDGGAVLGVGLDVVVLEEGSGPTAGVAAFWVRFVDDPLLAAGRGTAAGAGIYWLAVGVDDQQRNERLR